MRRNMMKPIIFSLLFSTFIVQAQEKEDPSRMLREVITLEVERTKYASKDQPEQSTTNSKASKIKKSVESEIIPEESLPPYIPAPQQEILDRAQEWYNTKAIRYQKTNGSNTGRAVTCNVSFNYKQKQLNPESLVDGKIIMDVVIDAKEGKYRYTIKNLRHKGDKAGMSGGDVYNLVPECGTVLLPERLWRLIRAEALVNANLVVEDLKAKMKQEVIKNKDDW
jgi:hypothetical protein